MTKEMRVEIQKVIPFFYRIFENFCYKQHENVLLSKQNYVLIDGEWYPIEDFTWLSSDFILNNPVEIFFAKSCNLCTDNYYVVYTDIIGVSESKIPYCKYSDLDKAIDEARNLKTDELYEYVAVINDNDEVIYTA